MNQNYIAPPAPPRPEERGFPPEGMPPGAPPAWEEERQTGGNMLTAAQRAKIEEAADRLSRLSPQKQNEVLTMWCRFVDSLEAQQRLMEERPSA